MRKSSKQMDEVLARIATEEQKNVNKEKKGDFASGFILSLCFPKEKRQYLCDIEKITRLSEKAAGKLSLFCDFTICPVEDNVLPMLIYTSSVMDERSYRKLSEDVRELMEQICQSVFGMIPEIRAGFLVADIEERLPRSIYISRELIKPGNRMIRRAVVCICKEQSNICKNTIQKIYHWMIQQYIQN